jgi:chorismate mutase
LKLLLLFLSITLLSSAQADCDIKRGRLKSKINRKDVSLLKRFLKRKSQFDTPTCLAKALIYTIKNKNIIIRDYLITQNTDLDYIDHSTHESPASLAITMKDTRLLSKLLKNNANPKLIIENKSLLDIATEVKLNRSLQILEEYGVAAPLDCSLKNSMIPQGYHERKNAVLKVALIYYGNGMKMSDLKRIEPILKRRFYEANERNVEVEIVSKKVISFKQKMPADYKFKKITDKKRLQRIWYYDNVGPGIMKEVYDEYKKEESEDILDELDAIVAITGGQFDGLGFASGRVSVTEYPQEIAWNLESGGRVDYPSDYSIVDELVHELGHNMFLGHTSTHCQKPGLTLEQKNACCNASPSKNDVMSYCRKRAAVSEEFMHKFESCNVEIIKDLIVPAMLSGGNWQVSPRQICK